MKLRRREFLGTMAATAALPPIQVPDFPRNFVWGAATSAYQIEGAAVADGKGPSVWDEFVRRSGVIADGQSGDFACDWYHRYPEGIALMQRLGLKAFRFSVAWTRVLPEGTGAVNQPGLDFYRRQVDALLAAGIEPILTLFHWDTPLALQRRDGWQNRDMVQWFGDYAAIVARALGDRVRWWLTVNEPRSFIGGGYVAGVQAPGLRLSRRDALAAAHQVLLAHGRAVQGIRAAAPRARIGIPNDITPVLPLTPDAAHAAEAFTWATRPEHFTAHQWWDENAWWHDPIYSGTYPSAAFAALGPDAPTVAPGDMALIAQPLDFIAANVYGGRRVAQSWPPGFPITANGWQVTPEALLYAPRWLHRRYGLPVFITENGCATREWIALDGAVHDPQRTDFLARYLAQLARAMNAGTPVLGYLHWSLLDNFEWQSGFTQRFGLVYVDFATGRWVLKDSARWLTRQLKSS